MRFLLLACVAATLSAQVALGPHVAAFEQVWSTIRDTHWQKQPAGLDWQAIHDEYRPRIERAQTIEDARRVMQEMLGRLKQTHFSIIPGAVYSKIDETAGDATPGIDLRVLDGAAVVTAVDPGSPAEIAGVGAGWVVESVRGTPLAPLIQAAKQDAGVHELQLTRTLLARLTGAPGAKIPVVFLDGQNRRVPMDLGLADPRGNIAQFGNLPPTPVWYEDKRLGGVAYARFNMFLDIPRVMPAFERTVKNCAAPCRGLIVDLRGNPGGIGGMAMGMAGFLVDKPGLRLGTMYLRDASLNFAINPRPNVFTGPVAVLVDANSASTSEIFAGGLQDIGRARVFGTPTAAAALPSLFARLPNGDGFQYAIANYVSAGGQPLEALGVKPDVEVRLTREALLTGRDPVVEAALAWIEDWSEKENRP